MSDKKKEKKNRIIEAAARAFAAKGFAGTVMTDIAVQAGIGKGTIYEYFSGKEELFFAVFEWYVNETGKAATVGVAALTGKVAMRLEVLNKSVLSSWGTLKDVYSLSMEFWAASASSHMRERFKDEFQKAYQDYRCLVSALIREGIDHGEFRSDINPESVAAALVGTWDALLLQAWFDEDFDPEAVAEDFIQVVLKGLMTAPPDN
jgi:AcrR family transcriptional regulator